MYVPSQQATHKVDCIKLYQNYHDKIRGKSGGKAGPRDATRKQLRRMDAHTWRESIALWQRLGKDGFVVGTGGEIYFVAV
jgi:hypothetical protein